MTTGVLPQELVFPRARVVRTLGTGDVISHRRVRVVVLESDAFIYESDGSLTLHVRIAESTYGQGARSFTLQTDNGESWAVEKMGCNCGG